MLLSEKMTVSRPLAGVNSLSVAVSRERENGLLVCFRGGEFSFQIGVDRRHMYLCVVLGFHINIPNSHIPLFLISV